MLLPIKLLSTYAVQTSDGWRSQILDLLFDDRNWAVRYWVLRSGGRFTRKRVLISPAAFQRLDRESRTIQLNLSSEQIENSPDLDTDNKITRQMEMEYFDHYRWP